MTPLQKLRAVAASDCVGCCEAHRAMLAEWSKLLDIAEAAENIFKIGFTVGAGEQKKITNPYEQRLAHFEQTVFDAIRPIILALSRLESATSLREGGE